MRVEMLLMRGGDAMPKDCVTCGAGSYVALPAWSAEIVQVPAASPVTVLPEIEQVEGVVLAKTIGLPDAPPVALTVPVPPTVTFAGAAPNTIAWLVLPETAKLRVTRGAGAKFALPAWSALIVQVPLVTRVSVPPAVIVQTPVVDDVKVTASPSSPWP
jgi:hypothetical protein